MPNLTGLQNNQEYLQQPETLIQRLQGLKGRMFGTGSVMEPGFKEGLLAEEGAPIDYSNIPSVAGGRVRQAFIDPVKSYAEAARKGMSGEQLSIKDLLAITEGNLDFAAGGGFLSGVRSGFDPTNIKSFPAWHGSPSGFEKFADKAIGSGEGAQYFGHGHYLAESKGIAKSYAKMGERPKTFYKGDVVVPGFDQNTPLNEWAVKAIEVTSTNQTIEGNFAQTRKDLQDNVDWAADNPGAFAPDTINMYKARINALDKLDLSDFEVKQGEHLYKTTVHKGKQPGEYQYLDYHKPLGEQPEMVEKLKSSGLWDDLGMSELKELRLKKKYADTATNDTSEPMEWISDYLADQLDYEDFHPSESLENLKEMVGKELALRKTGEEMYFTDDTNFLEEVHKTLKPALWEELTEFSAMPVESLTGEMLYKHVTELLESDVAASQKLKEFGIAGIKYDAGTLSGGTKRPISNYVVFDPTDITIEEHYINNALQELSK